MSVNYKATVEVLIEAAQCALCNKILCEPKTLPCFHSFCKQCIDDTLIFNDDGSATIICPETECSGNFVISTEDTSAKFSSSIHFMKIIQALMNFDTR